MILAGHEQTYINERKAGRKMWEAAPLERHKKRFGDWVIQTGNELPLLYFRDRLIPNRYNLKTAYEIVRSQG